jgi:hypothetical protein
VTDAAERDRQSEPSHDHHAQRPDRGPSESRRDPIDLLADPPMKGAVVR